MTLLIVANIDKHLPRAGIVELDFDPRAPSFPALCRLPSRRSLMGGHLGKFDSFQTKWSESVCQCYIDDFVPDEVIDRFIIAVDLWSTNHKSPTMDKYEYRQ